MEGTAGLHCFQARGHPPPPTPGPAFHPAPGFLFFGRTKKRNQKKCAPAASAKFFAGGRTNSRPSTSYGADRTGPAPLPAKNSSHNAFMGWKNQPKANKNSHGKPRNPKTTKCKEVLDALHEEPPFPSRLKYILGQ